MIKFRINASKEQLIEEAKNWLGPGDEVTFSFPWAQEGPQKLHFIYGCYTDIEEE